MGLGYLGDNSQERAGLMLGYVGSFIMGSVYYFALTYQINYNQTISLASWIFLGHLALFMLTYHYQNKTFI